MPEVENLMKKLEPLETKDIDIEYEGKPEKVTIKRLGWVEKNDFLEEYVDIKEVGNKTTVIPHPFKMRVGAVQKCIVKAPFNLDLNSLNKVDPAIMEKLYKEIDSYNNLKEDQKKK